MNREEAVEQAVRLVGDDVKLTITIPDDFITLLRSAGTRKELVKHGIQLEFSDFVANEITFHCPANYGKVKNQMARLQARLVEIHKEALEIVQKMGEIAKNNG